MFGVILYGNLQLEHMFLEENGIFEVIVFLLKGRMYTHTHTAVSVTAGAHQVKWLDFRFPLANTNLLDAVQFCHFTLVLQWQP